MFELKVNSICGYTQEEIDANCKWSKKYRPVAFKSGRGICAVVGGGPSLDEHFDDLKKFPGDIYGVNGAATYLSDNGIGLRLLMCDCAQEPFKPGPLVTGALLATRVHKNQFKLFNQDDVRTWPVSFDSPGGITGGPTLITFTPLLFAKMGYREVHYFGCDGSFVKKLHAYDAEGLGNGKNLIVVRAGGRDYLTHPGHFVQCERMAQVIKAFGGFLINKSGGLLKAMLEHDNWGCVALSSDLKNLFGEHETTKYNWGES
jgi:hypothetical protein